MNDSGSNTPDTSTPPAKGCALYPGAFFCDDFDQGSLGAKWDQNTLSFGKLDSAAVSTPNGLKVDLVESGSPTTGYLVKTIGGSPKAVASVSFDMRVDKAAPVYPFGIFCANNYRLSFNLDVNHIAEQGNGTLYTGYSTNITFPTNVWRRIELVIDQAQGTVRMYQNGSPAMDKVTLTGRANFGTSNCALAVGMYYADAQLSWVGRFDNVVIRVD